MHHQEVKTTIMIVDDTPANLDLLRSMLAAPGYRVTVFPSGASALSAAALRPPDLILLDILMPEMDGYETCRRLKASEALREIPCLSGDYLVERIFHNDSELQEQAMLITHQADPELGTLAYTVITLDGDGQLVRLEHHYPLQPQGVRVIADQLTQRCTEQSMERQVLHPGRLLYSDSSRSLQPATLADLPASTERLH